MSSLFVVCIIQHSITFAAVALLCPGKVRGGWRPQWFLQSRLAVRRRCAAKKQGRWEMVRGLSLCLSAKFVWHSQMEKQCKMCKAVYLQNRFLVPMRNTVDGRNPKQPLGMYKNLHKFGSCFNWTTDKGKLINPTAATTFATTSTATTFSIGLSPNDISRGFSGTPAAPIKILQKS